MFTKKTYQSSLGFVIFVGSFIAFTSLLTAALYLRTVYLFGNGMLLKALSEIGGILFFIVSGFFTAWLIWNELNRCGIFPKEKK